LRGELAIRDASGKVRLSKSIVEKIGPNQVGGVLVTFQAWRVAGREPHRVSIQWTETTDEFLARYHNI
jgi:hypothetical protein